MHYSILHLLLQQAKFTKGVWLCLCPVNKAPEVGEREGSRNRSLPHTIEKGVLPRIQLLPGLIAAKYLLRQDSYFLLILRHF